MGLLTSAYIFVLVIQFGFEFDQAVSLYSGFLESDEIVRNPNVFWDDFYGTDGKLVEVEGPRPEGLV